MLRYIHAFIALTISFMSVAQTDFSIVIHGGAGVMSRDKMDSQRQEEYRQKLEEALNLGVRLLIDNTPAVDVVVQVINVLEDSPLFNAGKGAVFTHEERVELDASIMEGKNLMAGAVTGLRDVKNPINAAREVMLHSDHVFLSGEGASHFARERGLNMVPNRYFHTDVRLRSLKQLKEKAREKKNSDNIGTVGCVVLDKEGNLAAGTSTGGMTNKRYGRIGDSPVIGAGTYANNKSCAVSCTGHGEYYIRLSFARDLAALMEYKGLSLTAACREEMNKLQKMGGTGGVIAVDAKGNIAMDFNTSGMFRAWAKENGDRQVAIFRER